MQMGATAGMAIGTQIAQPEPAAIATASVRAKVHRGVHRAGAAVGRGHRLGWHRRGRLGMRGFLRTQGTRRFVRQAVKGFRLVGSFTFGLDGRRCRWYRSPSVRLGNMQHDEEPHEGHQSELVVKKVCNHDIAPSPAW